MSSGWTATSDRALVRRSYWVCILLHVSSKDFEILKLHKLQAGKGIIWLHTQRNASRALRGNWCASSIKSFLHGDVQATLQA